MAQGKLWLKHRLLSFLVGGFALILSVCAHGGDDANVGMTMVFIDIGSSAIVVKRFDPDGLRGPVPGWLGAGGGESRGGAQMSFMPGDSKRGMPKFVEVEWDETTPESESALAEIPERLGHVTQEERNAHDQKLKEAYSKRKKYIRRVDLTTIVTPQLIEQVRQDRQKTQLRLTIRFNNDQVEIQADAYKWRK
jgi:hypothetical protein